MVGVPEFQGWSLNLYEAAGEAGGCWINGTRKAGSRGVKGAAVDPERSAAEAGRRARTRIRRYCAANRLNRFGTLTYAGDGNFDQVALRAHVGEFFRGLRSGLGGKPLPYVWVPEWHKRHGLHVHFAVGRYVRHGLIKATWGRGHVHIKLIGDLPTGSGNREEARIAAGYLAKYAGKGFDAERLSGLHRYDVAQGFAPVATQLRARRLEDVLSEACGVMRARPSYVWLSDEVEDWAGPPAVSVRWT